MLAFVIFLAVGPPFAASVTVSRGRHVEGTDRDRNSRHFFGSQEPDSTTDNAKVPEQSESPLDVPFRQHTNGSTPAGWVQIGTPKKWLYVIFDTGSDKLVAKTWESVQKELGEIDQGIADMVLPSSKIYDHGTSTTYEHKLILNPLTHQMEPLASSITYGSGTALTEEGTDEILVGGRTLQNFTIMEITKDSLNLLHTTKGLAGVLGLQHMKNQSLGHSLFSRLRDARLLSSFGYCRRGDSNDGTFIWGDTSTDGHEIDVIGDMHWAVKVGSISIQSNGAKSLLSTRGRREKSSGDWTDVPLFADASGGDDGESKLSATDVDEVMIENTVCANNGCTGILDTGSNIIAGPSSSIKELNRMLKVMPDCSNFDKLPNIELTFGGIPVTIEPHGYVMKVPRPDKSTEEVDEEAGDDEGDAHVPPEASASEGQLRDQMRQQEIQDGGIPVGYDVRIEVEPESLKLQRRHGGERGGLAQRRQKRASKSQLASRRWKAAFERLNKEYGVDLRELVDDILKTHNSTREEFMCMPALVPLDKTTSFGPLWVVGTPLLDSYYARWSFDHGATSPKIHLEALEKAEACKADMQGSVATATPMMMRSEPTSSAAARGPLLRKLEDIYYPHWAKELARV